MSRYYKVEENIRTPQCIIVTGAHNTIAVWIPIGRADTFAVKVLCTKRVFSLFPAQELLDFVELDINRVDGFGFTLSERTGDRIQGR